jgi:hypothetical protein
MLSIVVVPAALLAAACEEEVPFTPVERFKATLSGLEEVPSVVTTAVGTATFLVQGEAMAFDVTLANAPAITAAHIHMAARGANGGAIVTLGGALAPTVTVNGTAYSGLLTNSSLSGITIDELVTLFRNGGAYVNVHSVGSPSGLIRGQIAPY